MAHEPSAPAWRVDCGHPEVHYQPIVDLQTRSALGVEALARWRTPDGHLLPPAAFVPLAEGDGTIGVLGRFVRDRAIVDVIGLAGRVGRPVDLHVNVSAHEVEDTLPKSLEVALGNAGLAPGLLVVEVTESSPFADPERTVGVLRQLTELGVRLALDDFGTGWSGPERLRQVSTQVVKIDRSDVAALDSDIARFRIQAILRYADKHGLEVVAEGIETPAQAEWLQTHGCTRGQGFLFGQPVPYSEAAALLGGSQNIRPIPATTV